VSFSKNQNKKRIFFLDEIKGLAIICMVVYHAVCLAVHYFFIESLKSILGLLLPLQPFLAGFFILLAGVCSNFSRSNFKRGIKLLIFATAITTMVTIFFPEKAILFGVLHMLSFCVLLYVLIKPIVLVCPSFVGLLICTLAFIFTKNINNYNFLNITDYPHKNFIDFILGFNPNAFISADYFPVFPWIFLFFCGVFLGKFLKNLTKFAFIGWTYKNYIPFLSFIGSKSLLIYLIHQPILYGLFHLTSFLGEKK
jgi:uncharacterized membrane protein